MYDIDSTGVKIDIALIALIKALYPTYSNYLESLQASGNLKSLTFDTLADKIAEREKAFGKKTCEPTSNTLCIAQKGKNVAHDSSRGESSNHGHGRRNHKFMGGRSNQGDHEDRKNLHCTRCDRRGHEDNTYCTPWDKIKE